MSHQKCTRISLWYIDKGLIASVDVPHGSVPNLGHVHVESLGKTFYVFVAIGQKLFAWKCSALTPSEFIYKETITKTDSSVCRLFKLGGWVIDRECGMASLEFLFVYASGDVFRSVFETALDNPVKRDGSVKRHMTPTRGTAVRDTTTNLWDIKSATPRQTKWLWDITASIRRMGRSTVSRPEKVIDAAVMELCKGVTEATERSWFLFMLSANTITGVLLGDSDDFHPQWTVSMPSGFFPSSINCIGDDSDEIHALSSDTPVVATVVGVEGDSLTSFSLRPQRPLSKKSGDALWNACVKGSFELISDEVVIHTVDSKTSYTTFPISKSNVIVGLVLPLKHQTLVILYSPEERDTNTVVDLPPDTSIYGCGLLDDTTLYVIHSNGVYFRDIPREAETNGTWGRLRPCLMDRDGAALDPHDVNSEPPSIIEMDGIMNDILSLYNVAAGGSLIRGSKQAKVFQCAFTNTEEVDAGVCSVVQQMASSIPGHQMAFMSQGSGTLGEDDRAASKGESIIAFLEFIKSIGIFECLSVATRMTIERILEHLAVIQVLFRLIKEDQADAMEQYLQYATPIHRTPSKKVTFHDKLLVHPEICIPEVLQKFMSSHDIITISEMLTKCLNELTSVKAQALHRLNLPSSSGVNHRGLARTPDWFFQNRPSATKSCFGICLDFIKRLAGEIKSTSVDDGRNNLIMQMTELGTAMVMLAGTQERLCDAVEVTETLGGVDTVLVVVSSSAAWTYGIMMAHSDHMVPLWDKMRRFSALREEVFDTMARHFDDEIPEWMKREIDSLPSDLVACGIQYLYKTKPLRWMLDLMMWEFDSLENHSDSRVDDDAARRLSKDASILGGEWFSIFAKFLEVES